MDKLLNSNQYFITNNINSNIIVKPIPIKQQFNAFHKISQADLEAADNIMYYYGFTNAKRIRLT
jgi:hypothetical protein